MIPPVYHDPGSDEQFYARALAILVAPGRRVALALRLLNACYWLAVLGMLGWLLAQVLYRPVPIADRHQRLVTPAVRAGDPVKVDYGFTRLQNCAADVYWQETDGSREVRRFGPVHVASPGEPGPDHFTYAWPTPRTASPGPSRLRVSIEFQCPGNYLEAFWPALEVLPEIAYETLPITGSAIEPPAAGPP